MFAQVKDMKCVSSKRPLPIIAEQDVNVAELNTFSNCQREISNFSKDRASFQPGALNSDDVNEYSQPQGSDSTSQKMTKGKRRNKTKQSTTPSPKSQKNHTPKQSTTASSSKSHQNHAPKQSSSKSPENFNKPALSASNSGKHDVGATIAVLESSPTLSSDNKDLHSYKDADLNQWMKYATHTNSSDSHKKHVHEHRSLETDSAFTKLISNERLHSNIDSQTTAPVDRSGECWGNAVETDKAPVQARLSISLPAHTQCVAPAADIAPESWTQAADLSTMHDMDNSAEQNVPQITITTAEGSQYQTSMASPPTPDSDDDCIGKISSLIHSSSMFGQPSTHRTCGHASGKRPKPFAHLSTIMIPECSGPPFENERKEGNPCASPNPEHSSAVHLSDFWRLKETTEKLHLSTRRPSTMLWKQQYMGSQGLPVVGWGQSMEAPDEDLTTDRRQRIDEALEWLRNELQEMRSQDQNLARQLLTIRQDIHQLKLQRSTEEHREFLEDFQCELDDIQEFSDVLDLPKHMYGNNPLKHVGVTRLNISARRFSAC